MRLLRLPRPRRGGLFPPRPRRVAAAHTVLETIVPGPPRVRGFLNLRGARREVEALCNRYGFTVDLGARVWQLSEGERQWVEILKALYGGAKILILDEPTSLLPPPGVKRLLAGLQALVRDRGVTVLLVTHKLPVVMAASHRVTVFRSGSVVARLRTGEATEEILVQPMIGREGAFRTADRSAEAGRPLPPVGQGS